MTPQHIESLRRGLVDVAHTYCQMVDGGEPDHDDRPNMESVIRCAQGAYRTLSERGELPTTDMDLLAYCLERLLDWQLCEGMYTQEDIDDNVAYRETMAA